MKTNIIYNGDARKILKRIDDNSIQCIVTSPPYFNLRNYGSDEMNVIWGGNPDCKHEFELKEKKDPMDRGGKGDHDADGLSGTKIQTKNYKTGFCKRCGAWYGQLGLEEHPQDYINHLLEVIIECMRVLKEDGVMFLNLGDSYATHRSGKDAEINISNEKRIKTLVTKNSPKKSIKSNWFQEKQKLLIPHRVAIALQNKGFFIRDDIVWVKKMIIYPNKESIGSTMPFPVKDRLLSATEYIFQITKSPKYFFNLKSVKTPIKFSTIKRATRPILSTYTNQTENNPYLHHKGIDKYYKKIAKKYIDDNNKARRTRTKLRLCGGVELGRNWNVGLVNVKKANPTNAIMFKRRNQFSKKGFQEHFATFPESLAEFFIKISSKRGDIVLDPFAGSGTTLLVAKHLARKYIGIELSKKYVEIIKKRLCQKIINDF